MVKSLRVGSFPSTLIITSFTPFLPPLLTPLFLRPPLLFFHLGGGKKIVSTLFSGLQQGNMDGVSDHKVTLLDMKRLEDIINLSIWTGINRKSVHKSSG